MRGLPVGTNRRGAAKAGGAIREGVGENQIAAAVAGSDDDPVRWVCVASRKRVLIVDDNDRHLDILAAVLGSVGYDVETCGSGAEALRRLMERFYDVAVLDLLMPEVSGVAVAREMRKGGLNTLTPIIVCTANVPLASRQLAGAPGVYAIIAKPIDTADLILAVARAPAPPRDRPASEIRV